MPALKNHKNSVCICYTYRATAKQFSVPNFFKKQIFMKAKVLPWFLIKNCSEVYIKIFLQVVQPQSNHKFDLCKFIHYNNSPNEPPTKTDKTS